MTNYDKPRPTVPADIRRAVEVESGHACAVALCRDHTYLDLHHINGNREDNKVENLVLLCTKHHRMAHAGEIDRQSLREYKRLLRSHYSSDLHERVRRLEELLTAGGHLEAKADAMPAQEAISDPGLPSKTITSRSSLMYMTLEQLALTKYEKDCGLLFERQPRFTKGEANIFLDAVRQDDDLSEDVVVEVRWLRKRYLDAPIWVRQIEAATSAYELITGRAAKGVLIFVVPKEDMKTLEGLPVTADELRKLSKKPEIVIYTYAELGFEPGPITAELSASNLKIPGNVLLDND